MGWRRQLLRRGVSLVVVLFAVTALTFSLTALLPGDPTTSILGPVATPETVAQLRQEMGLDHPLPVRYVIWMADVVRGDLGTSYLTTFDVDESIRSRLPVTIQLLVLSQVLALLIAVPLAIASARRPNGLVDRFTTVACYGLISVPFFMLAVLFVFVFAERLRWLPATGYTELTRDPLGNLRTMLLPAFSLGIAEVAGYARILRADLMSTLQEDFVTVARAKGLRPRYILLRHALRPSTFSTVTIAGLNVGQLIGGAFIVELIFALPGIGSLGIAAIYSRDYLVVQGTVLLVAVSYVLVNFVVDLIYVVLDPRTRAKALG